MKGLSNLALVGTLLLALLVLPIALLPSSNALPERSWSRSLVVAAGESQSVIGGIDFASNIQVHGTVKVQSCCGFSTNDIDFLIRGWNYGGKGFGVIAGTFGFEWDSGQNDKYEFTFDNEWVVCGGTPFTCAGNESSPSYHGKTVELNVNEVAPLTPYLSTVLQIFWPLILIGSVPLIVWVVLYVRRKRS